MNYLCLASFLTLFNFRLLNFANPMAVKWYLNCRFQQEDYYYSCVCFVGNFLLVLFLCLLLRFLLIAAAEYFDHGVLSVGFLLHLPPCFFCWGWVYSFHQIWYFRAIIFFFFSFLFFFPCLCPPFTSFPLGLQLYVGLLEIVSQHSDALFFFFFLSLFFFPFPLCFRLYSVHCYVKFLKYLLSC